MGTRFSILSFNGTNKHKWYMVALELGEEDFSQHIASERVLVRDGYQLVIRGSIMDTDFQEFTRIRRLVDNANDAGYLDMDALV